MKTSTLLTAAVAAVSMLGAPSAFAAAPAASKLSLASAPSLRAGGVDQRRVNRQSCSHFFGCGLLSNPIVIAGVVATAIAVPVALANSSPSSP